MATAVAWAMFPYFGPANLIMMYLIAVIVIAIRLGRGPSVLASVLSVATFDFFFVPPYLSFAVSDIQYVLTFGIMLIVALVISNLAVRIREQAELARDRERRTARAVRDEPRSWRRIEAQPCWLRLRRSIFERSLMARWRFFLRMPKIEFAAARGATLLSNSIPRKPVSLNGCSITMNGQGSGTDTLPGASALYLPLVGSTGPIGVVAVRPKDTGAVTGSRSTPFARIAHQSSRLGDRTNSSLGGSPAGSRASGNGTYAQCHFEFSLSRLADSTGDHHRSSQQLVGRAEPPQCDTIASNSSIHLPRGESIGSALKNLLDMMRIEAGAVHLNKEWHPLDEIVGAALARLEERLQEYTVHTTFPPDLPMVQIDGVLMEQVVINLLENAAKYAPAGSAIDVSASAGEQGSGRRSGGSRAGHSRRGRSSHLRQVLPRETCARRRSRARTHDLSRHRRSPWRAYLGRKSHRRWCGISIRDSPLGGAASYRHRTTGNDHASS